MLICWFTVGLPDQPSPRHHSSLQSREQSSRNSAGAAPSVPRLITGLHGATAAGLRFQKGGNVPELISDRGPVDPPERAADVQSSFVLQDFHAAPANGGVYVFIDPRPRDRGNLRQIDNPGSATHHNNASTRRSSTNLKGRPCRTSISTTPSRNRLN